MTEGFPGKKLNPMSRSWEETKKSRPFPTAPKTSSGDSQSSHNDNANQSQTWWIIIKHSSRMRCVFRVGISCLLLWVIVRGDRLVVISFGGWGLGVEERVGIREAFRRAYEYVSFSLLTCWIMANGWWIRECLRRKVLNVACGLDNLFWDAENKKWLVLRDLRYVAVCANQCNYIVDFKFWSRPIASLSEWGPHILKQWWLHEWSPPS